MYQSLPQTTHRIQRCVAQSAHTMKNMPSGYALAALWWWSCLVAARAELAGPSERPEAYFNGSSYIHIARPLSLHQLVGLSFRTCVACGQQRRRDSVRDGRVRVRELKFGVLV
ncbi:hypothetical protein ACJJTC_002081 [Scirpophaga incertulas]